MSVLRQAPIVVAAVLVACSDPAGPGNGEPQQITALPRALSAGEQAIIEASGRFAFPLLREINRDWRGKNVFISPLSASMALGMTMNGAAGTTFDEMRQALGFGTRPLAEINAGYHDLISLLQGLDPGVTFDLANAIWYDAPFGPAISPAFLATVRQWFDAEAGPLAFGTPQSVATINDWAKQHTRGKIDRVIDDTRDLVMLLANAIYFKGDWRDRFDKALTKPEPFTVPGAGRVSVATMQRSGPARYARSANATVFEMAYGGDAFAMTILLPDDTVDVEAFIAGLAPEAWPQATAGLADYTGEIHLPKFTLAWKDTLNGALKRLGMVSAFVPGGADFTALSPTVGRQLFIDFVKQDSYVDVNEEGTEAAAVTTVGIGVTSIGPPPVIRVDRPFVFAIRERLSGTVLFLGKIVDPR